MVSVMNSTQYVCHIQPSLINFNQHVTSHVKISLGFSKFDAGGPENYYLTWLGLILQIYVLMCMHGYQCAQASISFFVILVHLMWEGIQLYYHMAETFTNFTILEPPAKVFSTKFGRTTPTHDRFQHSAKWSLLPICESFLPQKFPAIRYIANYIYIYTHLSTCSCSRQRVTVREMSESVTFMN